MWRRPRQNRPRRLKLFSSKKQLLSETTHRFTVLKGVAKLSLEKLGAEDIHKNLLSDSEFRENRPSESHTYGSAYNSISNFSFTVLFVLNSV